MGYLALAFPLDFHHLLSAKIFWNDARCPQWAGRTHHARAQTEWHPVCEKSSDTSQNENVYLKTTKRSGWIAGLGGKFLPVGSVSMNLNDLSNRFLPTIASMP